jgi:hypothetical protein
VWCTSVPQMKCSELGLAAWCLGSWWCVLWIRNKQATPVEYALVYPLQRIYWLWQVLAVRRCRRRIAGGASHLPTRVLPGSSVDRARQYWARTGLRTKRSWVLDSTDLHGHPSRESEGGGSVLLRARTPKTPKPGPSFRPGHKRPLGRPLYQLLV